MVGWPVWLQHARVRRIRLVELHVLTGLMLQLPIAVMDLLFRKGLRPQIQRAQVSV